jgi:hypothetical protein
MEKFNKTYFAVWILLSALVLSVALVTMLDDIAGLLDPLMAEDSVGLSFIVLFFASEILGFILASLVIDHLPLNIQPNLDAAQFRMKPIFL